MKKTSEYISSAIAGIGRTIASKRLGITYNTLRGLEEGRIPNESMIRCLSYSDLIDETKLREAVEADRASKDGAAA